MTLSIQTPPTTPNIVKRRQHFERIFSDRIYTVTENYHLNWYRLLGLPPAFLQLEQQHFLQLASKIQGSQSARTRHRDDQQQTEFRNKWLIQLTACGNNTRTADICIGLAKAPHLHERKVNTNYESRGLAPKLRLSEVDQLKSKQLNQRILVDASNGQLTKHFKAQKRPGVSDIVAGTSHVKECLIQFQEGISFLPIGTAGKEGVSEPMNEFGARKLCRQLTLLNHSVIIHSPDIDKDAATVQSLAAAVRCTLGVIRFDTPFTRVKEYHDQLMQYTPHKDLLMLASRMPVKMRNPDDIWPFLFPGVLDQTTPLDGVPL
jgi:hypothetical protein